MRIIVDADAAPGIKLIENLAYKYHLECILISDYTHNLVSDYSQIITVDKGFQSVDMYLVNMIKKGDIIVTQDYGVAVICLSKACLAINPKGTIYTDEIIPSMLQQKHIASRLRRSKNHLKGPKKRTKEDDTLLINNLEKLINNDC